VEATEGPVLVLAGAGTGKTRVLTTRLAHLLFTGKAQPGEILAVTFTNRAAREMRARIEAVIGQAAEGLWLGTFHALAARILRRHAELAGLKANFSILDTDDQLRLIKQILQAENIDDKKTPPRAVLATIERVTDRAKPGEVVMQRVKTLVARQLMPADAVLTFAMSYAARKHIPVVYADVGADQAA